MPASGLIVAVCTANTCRSPMAAALLQHALQGQPEPLRSLRVTSAGVAARGGEPVSANSVTALRKVGIDISGHRSRALTPEMLREATLILCMTESHRMLVQLMVDPVPDGVHLFREFLGDTAEREIGDPFGGPLRAYEATRDEMVEAVPSLIAHLKTVVR
jgi:protein-tyrosine-phosphatase